MMALELNSANKKKLNIKAKEAKKLPIFGYWYWFCIQVIVDGYGSSINKA